MINKIIRNFIAKLMAGRSDDGIMITLRDPQKVELAENIMADLLMRNGIDPRAITSEAQLKTIINQIEAASKQTTESGIRNAESAKVFDLKGKRIKDTDNIMGGEEMPPPGSRGGKDDIAAPVQSSEESLKNMIEAENKKGIAKIKQRQKMLDDAIDNVSPSLTLARSEVPGTSLPPMIFDPLGISFPSRSNIFADFVPVIPLLIFCAKFPFSIDSNIFRMPTNWFSLVMALGSMPLRINRSSSIAT